MLADRILLEKAPEEIGKYVLNAYSISADSAKELGLEVGSKAVASVKSIDVVIEKGMK